VVGAVLRDRLHQRRGRPSAYWFSCASMARLVASRIDAGRRSREALRALIAPFLRDASSR
jgi:hypothetical protein